MPWSNLMVTGGVKPEAANLKGWFDAGVTCVGMGSNLFPKNIMDARDWTALTNLVKEVMAIAKEARK